MKLSLILVCLLMMAGCGGKKGSNPESQISEQYSLAAFDDVNNPSTFDMETLKDLPQELDLKEQMTSVKDQDERGTCSHFTTASLIESSIKRKMKVDVNVSEEYINYVSKKQGHFTQTEAGNSFANLRSVITKKEGVLLERDWPYQPSWFGVTEACMDFTSDSEDAPLECYSHNTPPENILSQKISGEKFESLISIDATTNDLVEILVENGPFSIGVPVNRRGWKDDGEVIYTEEMRQECISQKVDCGSHEVVITGYNLEEKVFYFKNSWGKKWGKDGYGTFPIDMIDRHANHYVAIVNLLEDIDLPADHDKNFLEVDDFQVFSRAQSDSSVKIQSTGKVVNVGYNTLKIGASLVKKKVGSFGRLDDLNAEIIELNIEDTAKFERWSISDANFYLPKEALQTKEWTTSSPDILNFDAELMTSATLKKLAQDRVPYFVRTTLYRYSDDAGYQVLKRYYHPADN